MDANKMIADTLATVVFVELVVRIVYLSFDVMVELAR
jgi:hypothetical protein